MNFKPWLALSVWALCACTPSLNWREVRLEDTALKTLLPCKPDHGSREVSAGGPTLMVRMSGCETQSHLLAVARLPMPAQARPAEIESAIAQWQSATLANMNGQLTGAEPLEIKAAVPIKAQRISASGRAADGRVVQSQWVMFAWEGQIIQAVVYAPKLQAEVSDTFFAGLTLP